MNRRLATVILAAAALTASCSTDTATNSVAAPTTNPPAEASTHQLGEQLTFQRADTGGLLGNITFTDAQILPPECVASTRPGHTIAIHVTIQNGPGEELTPPDVFQLKTNDADGFTHDIEAASAYFKCDDRFPEAAAAPLGGKTRGWVFIRAAELPAALVYAPFIGDQTNTPDDIRILRVSPASVAIDLGDRLSAPVPADEATTVVPAPTTAAAPRTTAAPAPVAPPTGRDSQGRANGSGGALVGCADENYQPGTGVYADGSRGFAAECLPGGSMR